MEWFLEHIRLIVIVGGAIAYWLNQRRKAKEEQEVAKSLSAPLPKAQMTDDAERTRRIQEEIRRKILERAGGSPQPRPTPPALPAAPKSVRRVQPPANIYTPPTEESVAADMAVLERQQQLAARLRELQEQRREHDRPAEVFAEKTAMAMSASETAIRGSVLADLRNPTAARRAMVLREVLGAPVGLR
jgi:hypothetical protein